MQSHFAVLLTLMAVANQAALAQDFTNLLVNSVIQQLSASGTQFDQLTTEQQTALYQQLALGIVDLAQRNANGESITADVISNEAIMVVQQYNGTIAATVTFPGIASTSADMNSAISSVYNEVIMAVKSNLANQGIQYSSLSPEDQLTAENGAQAQAYMMVDSGTASPEAIANSASQISQMIMFNMGVLSTPQPMAVTDFGSPLELVDFLTGLSNALSAMNTTGLNQTDGAGGDLLASVMGALATLNQTANAALNAGLSTTTISTTTSSSQSKAGTSTNANTSASSNPNPGTTVAANGADKLTASINAFHNIAILVSLSSAVLITVNVA